MLKSWQPRLEQKGIRVVIGGSDSDEEETSNPKGSKRGREGKTPREWKGEAEKERERERERERLS